MIEAGALEDRPSGPGAYALLLRLAEPADVPPRALPSAVLTPGTYGSSDCRSCAAHLLAVPPDSDFAALIMNRLVLHKSHQVSR